MSGRGDARPRVTVVGLGPAGPDLITAGTLAAIAAHPPEARLLRTDRHPAAIAVRDSDSAPGIDGGPGADGGGIATFDHVYDEGESLDEVYPAIVEGVVEAATRSGAVLYAVPGSPMVAERTVELLLADDRVEVIVLPALSFLDLAWARLGVDPIAQGARVVDGHRFSVEAAGERGPLLVAQCDSVDVLSDIKLAVAEALETRSELGSGLARRGAAERGPGVMPDDLRVTVVQRLGLDDEAVFEVAWHDLDREVDPDHLTSVWIPAYVAPIAVEVQRFAELVATLRRECPWDREQTHESLKRHLLEETYEVLDAIDRVDVDAGEGYDHLEEELGDLLFQVLFHATLAAEAGQFTLADVARGVHDKLYSRHPHVFGGVDAESADQVAANWEDLKKAEKGRTSIFDGVPDALPALLFALKVQKKADALELGSTVGDGRAGAPLVPRVAPVAECLAALTATGPGETSPELVGDLLFAAVALARDAGVDPEMALRTVAADHRDRVKVIEAAADERA